MYVQVMLKPSTEGEEYREKAFHAIPKETVDDLQKSFAEYRNDEAGAQRSVWYSFERTDGNSGRLSLDLERVVSIDAFEEDGPATSAGGQDPMIA